MKEKWKELLDLVPQAPDDQIAWNRVEQSQLKSYIEKMKMTEQNPVWHGEGNVWTHTKMVCEEMIKLPDFIHAERRLQEILFLSALFHDFGKIPCTKWEDGSWTSPHHTSASAGMAREILWKTYGFCGTKELQQFREAVCFLVRYHSVPPHILEQKKPEKRLLKIASNGEPAPDFTLKALSTLVDADLRGRIHPNTKESLEILDMFREMAKETGCFEGPKVFPSDYSKYAYLSGRNILPDQELYDDTWGEIILLSGLPGTGKDTFIKEHYPHLPMVSQDNIRAKLNISPRDRDKQSLILQAAREEAKEYLRNKQPFIWNATNLTPFIRSKKLSLFSNYGASTKIIYLETAWDEELRRNQNRKAVVPEGVIEHMMKSLVLPERFEAHKVEWKCV